MLPFKTSLFAAATGQGIAANPDVGVQTAAVVYTHLRGVPLSRADRPRIGWYGDMEMRSHAWGVLRGGPITVTIKVSPPVPLSEYSNRKDLALKTERAVRADVLGILRGRPAGEALVPVEPSSDVRRQQLALCPIRSEKWT